MINYTFDEYKRYLEQHLTDFLPDIDHKSITLFDAMKYSIDSGGKRIRPVLLLAACEFCGGRKEEALPYACAVEYIHTYTLIHDDLPCMDDDELRRGIPTNHKVFGEAVATLAGDGLQSAAFEVMNQDMLLYFDDPEALKKRVRAAYEISKGSGCRGVVAGQIADIEAEETAGSKELLDFIHLNKTAALIIASIRAGVRLGNPDPNMLTNLTVYGENLGLAFQITDDILDVVGDEKEMGKKTGADKANNKMTFPEIYGLEDSRRRLKEATEKALEAVSPYYDNAELFTELAITLSKRGR